MKGNKVMTRIYKLENEGREIHLPSDNQTVAIVWNLIEVTGDVEVDGKTYKTKEYVRKSEPYIDFVSIHDKEGKYYEDKDNPVMAGLNPAVGGINPELAQTIALELVQACQYLEKVKGDL